MKQFYVVLWHGGRVVKVLAFICVWTEQTQVRIPLRTLFDYKARSIVTGPTRPSSLEAGSYTGYQAELNIKARPGRVSSSGARVTMQQIPERYENSQRHLPNAEAWKWTVEIKATQALRFRVRGTCRLGAV